MDSKDIDRIRHYANNDVVRRMLIQYFMDKGYTESFDRLIYPPYIADLAAAVPALATKIEVVPHAVEINPVTGTAVLGWNLFVLGNQQMYLGESFHNDLQALARQLAEGSVSQGDLTARRQTTPRRVVNFITRTLCKAQSGYVDLSVQANLRNHSLSFAPRMNTQELIRKGTAGPI